MGKKNKTHKGMLKRMKVTGGGKLIRKRAGKSHLLSKKSGKRLRKLRSTKTVPGHIARKLKRELVRS